MNDAPESYRPRRAARRRRVDVRGLSLSLTEWGGAAGAVAATPADAAPLVLLHGWQDAGASFQFLVDAFGRERSCVALDWRGFGESDRDPGGYWFPDYLADLDALLDVLSPATPVCLLGHSLGGHVASLYAGLRPERVRCLVNLEGFGLPRAAALDAPSRLLRWLDEVRGAGRPRGYGSFAELAAVIRRRHPRVPPSHAAFLATAWGTLDGDGRVRLLADPRHQWINPAPLRREDVEACWRRIVAPTLLLHGDRSEYLERLGADATEPALRAAFPGAAIACVAGAGHMLHAEQPARVAALAEPFLDAH